MGNGPEKRTVLAPKGRHNVSPLRGLKFNARAVDPGLTPWAKLCRPFGAKTPIRARE